MNARSIRILIGVLAALLTSAGCGNLTSGGFGNLEVVVAADSVAGLPVQSAAPVPTLATVPTLASATPPRRQSSSDQAQADGTLTLRIQVFALTRPDTWIEVTEGVQQVVMPLSGAVPFTLARKELPAGTYAAIRTVFLQVVANVEGGLIGPDGQPVRGPVTVELGTEGRLLVDTPVSLTIAERGSSRIAVDLHTTRWLRLLNAQRQVRSQDFAGEVRVGRQP